MLFDSTVRRELARAFGATLVVILTIVLTMFLIRTVGQAAGGAVAPQDVVLLLGYVSLGHLPTMLALSLFVAIVVTLGRMYRDSEMVIWFASGLSLSRFVRPVLRTSWPVLLVVTLLLVLVWPWGNRSSLELRERYQQRSDLSRVTPGVFQSSSDGRRVFFVERESSDGINARNVFILMRPDASESVTSAKTGRLEVEGDRRYLVLERGQRNDINLKNGERTLSSFENYRVLASEGAARSVENRSPRSLRTIDLMRQPTPPNQGELVWRFGLMLAAANLLLLGIGLAATHPRRAGNWNLLFALLTFLIYYNLVNLSQSWVASGRVSMGLALLGTHGSVFALALALLWWRDHAAVTRFGRRPLRQVRA
ncbi:MAG: LPS export ABC transporter permease LptF [Rubrivivax sp.]|nr:LPS export ABC transporter permease LptF [Rubrivivax sp.]MDP1649540.1 LPS export ABC transporter permease LptF [Rubrivivax sp.]